MSATQWTLLLLAAAISATACQRTPRLTTPESDHAAYAALYPERLQSARTRFAEDEAEARESFDALRALPSGADAQSADELEQLVRRADAAGRSQHYVDEALRQEEVDALMHENKGAIRRRVAGSVAATAKELSKKEEKACLVEEDVNALAGSAASGTDRAVSRQLESRLRARNPAQQYLRAHADELGEQRVALLARQVDDLARVSFLSNVRLALHRIELDDLLDQQQAVRSTLARDEAEGRAALATEGLSRSHRLALEDQVARDEAARGALENEVAASQAAQDDLEARAEALRKDYQAMIDVMLGELARKSASAGPASGSSPTAPAVQPGKAAPAPKTGT